MTTYAQRLASFERQTSDAAIWCQRLAVFSVPFLLIIVLGHRFGTLDTPSTFWLLGIAVCILVAALLAGARGFYQLWSQGFRGGLRSARGMALAGILLLPFLLHGFWALTLPPLHDISTDLDNLPEFETVLDDRTNRMNRIVEPTDRTKQQQLRFYPKVSARRYPLDIARVFKEVVTLLGDRDWVILTANTVQGEAPIDVEESALVAKPVINSAGLPLRIPVPSFRPKNGGRSGSDVPPTEFETQQVSPIGRDTSEAEATENADERYVEAVATSFLFGFQSDVVIRLVEEEEGTLVDMRSVSRWGPHDLGSNAKRITGFMNDLDTALQGLGQGR